MEFCGREPIDVLGFGDCGNNTSSFDADLVREAFQDDGKLPRCKVPISSGTLLVFSNYQMVHRVLRMVNRTSDGEAARKFVALFIIDPTGPPLVPARQHLAEAHLLQHTLTSFVNGAKLLQASCATRVLEFLGKAAGREFMKKRRNELLRQQLVPKGEFSAGGHIYATGNGCFTMIGWLNKLLANKDSHHFELMPTKGRRALESLNQAPKTVGRGMSEQLSEIRRGDSGTSSADSGSSHRSQ